MRDLTDIVKADIAARAQRHGVRLLEELSKCAEALGPDSPRGISAKALVDEVFASDWVKPAITGPHTSIPSSEAKIAHSPLGIPVYPHSPHVTAAA